MEFHFPSGILLLTALVCVPVIPPLILLLLNILQLCWSYSFMWFGPVSEKQAELESRRIHQCYIWQRKLSFGLVIHIASIDLKTPETNIILYANHNWKIKNCILKIAKDAASNFKQPIWLTQNSWNIWLYQLGRKTNKTRILSMQTLFS